ncbi:MAG: hypothetical protein WCW84_07130 [Sulfurimonas sp.]|jgi:hypothetical protein
MPLNALMKWLEGKGTGPERKNKGTEGSSLADTAHRKLKVLDDLKYKSDDELKKYLKNGTPNERDAARAILQTRK